jgi:signal transduction histidine kinase
MATPLTVSTAIRRRVALGLFGLAALTSVLLVWPVLEADTTRLVSEIVNIPVAVGGGLLILIGASQAESRERRAWLLIGLGVIAQGVGESMWTWYGQILGVETPYPGPPDVAYLSGYIFMAAGIFLLPHARSSGFERARLLLDALVGTLAIGLIAWRVIFQPMAAQEAPLLELLVGFGYPVGDVLMLAAVVILSTRRGIYLRDGRLAALAAGLVIYMVGDTVYLLQELTAGYSVGTSLDATWLMSYALFALAGGLVGPRDSLREVREGLPPAWQAAIPYLAVVGLLTLFTFDLAQADLGGSPTILTIGVFLVIITIIIRQWVAARENRELVERERDHLVSVISHELRTPLTAIGGFLDLLTDDEIELPAEEQKEMLKISSEQAHHLGRIVTDLIQVSRSQFHADQMQMAEVSLKELVAGVLRSTPELEGQQVSVAIDRTTAVRADPDRVRQMLTNLLTNASRYGGGRLKVSAQPHGGLVEVAVEDDGAGVPARFESVIWKRFERGAHRLDSKIPGSGLGLSIVNFLATAQGGRTGYRRSTALGGSCFWFTLPLAGAPGPVEEKHWVEAVMRRPAREPHPA